MTVLAELQTATREIDPQGVIVVGRYRLKNMIGEGGMAEVWEAHDLRLDRPVAVKYLTLDLPGESDDEARGRFLREARVAAAVRHPNVVDVLDFGTDDLGRPFMVMELLVGESLEDRLERAPELEICEVVELMKGVLDGLDAVHRAGIVHRDIKPSNLFLFDDGRTIRPKVVDFGISRSDHRLHGPRSVLETIEGRLVGTPEYMSPEQVRGRGDIDLRSDLYSVGCVIYEALTGELPYPADAMGELLVSVALGGAPPVAVLRPDVGPSLSACVERAMAVQRGDRFQSAQHMLEALCFASRLTSRTQLKEIMAPPSSEKRRISNSEIGTLAGQSSVTNWVAGRWKRRLRSIAPAAVSVGLVSALAATAYVVTTSVDDMPLLEVGAAAITATESTPADSTAEVGVVSEVSVQSDVSMDARVAAPVFVVTPAAPEAVRSEPALARIRVTLHDVPSGATVVVDGTETDFDGQVLSLARGTATRSITVRHGDLRWRVTHAGDVDGNYRVRMRPSRRRSPSRTGAGVFRNLDY